MPDENLKYEQINWGWLNDYGGYKFAPITFYEHLYTSTGNTFKEAYERTLTDLEDGTFVVGAAKRLCRVDEFDMPIDLMSEGSTNIPVFFNGGTPIACEGPLTLNLSGDVNNDSNFGNKTIKGGTIVGNTITGTTLNGNVNFTNPIVLNFNGSEINQTTANITSSNLTFNIDLSLKTTGVTAASYGPSANASLAHAGTFSVPYITVDNKGRITAASTKTYTLPEGNKVSIAKASNTTKRYILTNSASGTEATNNQLMYYDSIYVAYNGSGPESAVLMGAAWNDYAEFRDQYEDIKPGYCVCSSDSGKVFKTMEKLSPCDGIVSDTYGFAIGDADECHTPLAVAGRVLAYCEGDRMDYHAGDTVCASANGKVCKMTREEIREYPDRIVGVVSEIPQYEIWNNGVEVKGRIWITVK